MMFSSAGLVSCSSQIEAIAPSEEIQDLRTTLRIPLSVEDATSFILDAFSPSSWATHTRDPFFLSHGFVEHGLHNTELVVVPVPIKAVNTTQAENHQPDFRRLVATPLSSFLSEDYRVDGGRATCFGRFEIAVAPVDSNESELSVELRDVLLYGGREFSLHVMGFVPKSTPVPAGHRDQAKLLRLIDYVFGKRLSRSDKPPGATGPKTAR